MATLFSNCAHTVPTFQLSAPHKRRANLYKTGELPVWCIHVLSGKLQIHINYFSLDVVEELHFAGPGSTGTLIMLFFVLSLLF